MKYKIALIGCGRISFKHIEAFVAMQDKVDLVAVASHARLAKAGIAAWVATKASILLPMSNNCLSA